MATIGTSPPAQRRSRFAGAAEARYVDAYRVARTIDWFGQALKVGGVGLGVVIWIAVAAFFGSMNQPVWGFLMGAIGGAYAGGILFVVGILFAAQGQLLKAGVDAAVHSSPFLNDDLKAATMSLRRSHRIEKPSVGFEVAPGEAPSSGHPGGPEGVSPDLEESQRPFCYHCGAELVDDASQCPSCGKRL